MLSLICGQLNSLLVSFKVVRVVKALHVEGRNNFRVDLIRTVAAPVIARGRSRWDDDGPSFAPLNTGLTPGVFVESLKLVTPVFTLSSSCRAQVALLLSRSRLSVLTAVSIRLCK